MEVIINIKNKNKIAAFLNLIKEIDYVELVDVKEETGEIPVGHRELLDKRLQKIEKGETTFKNWDLIKGKYETKAI